MPEPFELETLRKPEAEEVEERLHKRVRLRRRLLLAFTLGMASLSLLGLTFNRPTQSTEVGLVQSIENVTHRQINNVLNRIRGPVRVGIQIGHLDAQDHSEELANLRYSTGGHSKGINEVDINKAVALALKEELELLNIIVDIIPATVPPKYRADLVVSLHADSSPDSERRGYKSSAFRQTRNDYDAMLKSHLDNAYFEASGLPDDDSNVSGSMLEYYAFNRRFKHSVNRKTPAVIVELGYISNESDLVFLQSDQPAQALKEGILTYLEARDRLTLETASQ